jgi:hypothetical protein
MSAILLNAVVASGAGAARSVGAASNNLVVVYSAAGAAGSTCNVESSADGTTWITELSVSAPTVSPVATTQRVYITNTQFIRGNVTVYSAGTISVVLQSWGHGGQPLN